MQVPATAHERFWTEARRQLGDGAGTRALIGVDVEVVAIEARRLGQRRPPAAVVPIGTGARDSRPAPRLDGYDALLAAGDRP